MKLRQRRQRRQRLERFDLVAVEPQQSERGEPLEARQRTAVQLVVAQVQLLRAAASRRRSAAARRRRCGGGAH
eukprot:85836-Prymnesium_polylepis.1